MDFYVFLSLLLGLAFLVGFIIYFLAIIYIDGSRRAVQEEYVEEQTYFSVKVPRDNEYEI